MKKCSKCKKRALVTHNNQELCITHYNLLPQDEEEKPKPKKEININDYILL